MKISKTDWKEKPNGNKPYQREEKKAPNIYIYIWDQMKNKKQSLILQKTGEKKNHFLEYYVFYFKFLISIFLLDCNNTNLETWSFHSLIPQMSRAHTTDQ